VFVLFSIIVKQPNWVPCPNYGKHYFELSRTTAVEVPLVEHCIAYCLMVYESNKFHMLACEMEVCAIVILLYRYYRLRQPNDCDIKLVTVH